jgi:eukaryotic-like serine/threonine-protein kinase
MLGTVGKYVLKRKLGQGASSTVYLAIDTFTTSDVALKSIDVGVFRDPQRGKPARAQFQNEASLVGKLAHPHIVSMLDAVISDKECYIAMEYVPGGNLLPLTSPHNLLPIEHAIEIGFKCCGALNYAYRAGIVHRDIKPANIMVVSGTEIKLADFGAALLQLADTTQIDNIGSPAYMSPEQINGDALGAQSDMFSLAVVLYQLLVGQKPFSADNAMDVINKIRLEPPTPMGGLRKDLPPELERVLMVALAKNPADRYSTWAEFALELAKLGRLSVYQQTITDSEKFGQLRAIQMFKSFGDPDIWELVQAAQWKRVPPHQVIIREGDSGGSLFMITRGEVKITKHGRLLNVLRAGDCFGEMSYIKGDSIPRQATVESMTEVVVAEFGREAIESRVNPVCRMKVVYALLNTLVDRLALADARISQIIN